MEENQIVEKLLKTMITHDLDDELKENIIKVAKPPFPESLVCPQSPLDWFNAFGDLTNELNLITKLHNQDEEKLRETIKCVVRMPVIASFTNNGDENTWVVKLEMNPTRMLELYHRRHDKEEEEQE